MRELISDDMMQRLNKSAQELNQATEEFHEALVKLEDRINQLDVKVEVWMGKPINKVEDGILGYSRVGNNWRLAVKNDKGIKPLLNCSRHIRISAMDLIPELLEALNAKAEQVIRKMREAV